MPDPSPDTPSVCPACGSTQPAAPHTGRWWRLDDGTIDDTRHGRCPNEWHAAPAAPGSSSPATAADDWMVELTSSDPEPETYGTLVVDVDGGVWERTDKEGTRFGWSRVDGIVPVWTVVASEADPRSGVVRLIRPLEAQAARITELEAAMADHTLTTPTEETE